MIEDKHHGLTATECIEQAKELMQQAEDLEGHSVWNDFIPGVGITTSEAIAAIGEYIDYANAANNQDDVWAGLLTLARDILEWAAVDDESRAEAFSHARLSSPEATGQMLMEIFSDALMTFGQQEKEFFLKVAGIIGGDYIHVMRSVGAFMVRVDEFHITVR